MPTSASVDFERQHPLYTTLSGRSKCKAKLKISFLVEADDVAGQAQKAQEYLFIAETYVRPFGHEGRCLRWRSRWCTRRRVVVVQKGAWYNDTQRSGHTFRRLVLLRFCRFGGRIPCRAIR